MSAAEELYNSTQSVQTPLALGYRVLEAMYSWICTGNLEVLWLALNPEDTCFPKKMTPPSAAKDSTNSRKTTIFFLRIAHVPPNKKPAQDSRPAASDI